MLKPFARARAILRFLTDSRFNHTNLTEADFSDATHYNISAVDNTLKKTRFSLPEAISLLYSLDIILKDE